MPTVNKLAPEQQKLAGFCLCVSQRTTVNVVFGKKARKPQFTEKQEVNLYIL